MDEAFRGLALDKIVTEELEGVDIENPAARAAAAGTSLPTSRSSRAYR